LTTICNDWTEYIEKVNNLLLKEKKSFL